MARVRQQAEALISLIGDDQVSDLIVQIQDNIKKAVSQTTEHTAAISEGVSATDAMVEAWGEVSIEISKVTDVVGIFADLASVGMDHLRIAAQEGGMERRFQALTKGIGGASSAMMALRDASSGALAEVDIQSIASQALQAGISLKDTAEIFEIATRMASGGIGEQTEVTRQLVTTFAERTDGMLKANGVSVDFGQTLGNLTTAMVVDSDAMSENYKVQVLLREHLPQLQAEFSQFSTDSSVQQIGRMDAALKDYETRARKMARLTLFREHSKEFEKTISKTEDLVSIIDTYARDARKNMVAGTTASEKWANSLPFLFNSVAENTEKVKKAQQELTAELQFSGGLREHFIMKIDEEARAHVRQAKGLDSLKKKADEFRAHQVLLIRKYGLSNILLPQLTANYKKFRKEIGLTSDETQKSAKINTDIQASQKELNRDAVDALLKREELTGKNMLQQARYAASLKETGFSAEKFKAGLDAGTLSIGQQVEAFQMIETAMDEKATADFRQIMLNAQVADGLGYGTRAADLYKQAFQKLPRTFQLATEPLSTFIAMADASTNAMVKTVAVLMTLDKAELQMMKERGDTSGALAQLEARISVAKSRIVGLVQGGSEVRTRPKGGGKGGKESDADKRKKEIDEYKRLLPQAQNLMTGMKMEFEGMTGEILEAGGGLQEIASDASFWYDFKGREKAFEQFGKTTADSIEAAQKKVAEIQEAYSKAFKDEEIQKNSMIQELLRDAMADELDLVRSRFEKEEELRAAAIEKEKAYHDARIEAAAMATDIAKGMRSELSQYEMDWASDQLRLGEGLAVALDQMESQMRGFQRIQENLKKAGKDAGQAWGLAAPAMIAGAGMIAASMIENEVAKASVLALVETAASISSYATGDMIGGSLHAAAAVAYGTVAGLTASGVMRKGGAGGSGSKEKPQAPALAEPEVREEAKRAPVNIVVNFTGSTIVGTDRKRLQRDLTSILRESQQYGDQTNPEAIGD